MLLTEKGLVDTMSDRNYWNNGQVAVNRVGDQLNITIDSRSGSFLALLLSKVKRDMTLQLFSPDHAAVANHLVEALNYILVGDPNSVRRARDHGYALPATSSAVLHNLEDDRPIGDGTS